MAAFLRAARNASRLQHYALAGGIALAGAALSQATPVQAAEKDADIFVINGSAASTATATRHATTPSGLARASAPPTDPPPPTHPFRATPPLPSLAASTWPCVRSTPSLALQSTTTSSSGTLPSFHGATSARRSSAPPTLSPVCHTAPTHRAAQCVDPSSHERARSLCAAEEGALRKAIFKDWKQLGLKSEPNVGDNGMHASASPFEALAERLNWMSAKLEDDPFGKAMLDSGIPKDTIMEWTKDPQVAFEGKKQSIFDLLEDLDYDQCLARAQAVAGVSGTRPKGKMQAFVFIKPHAVTDATKALVASHFAKAGIISTKEGKLEAAVIEKDKLIDNHYYAIANKATHPRLPVMR